MGRVFVFFDTETSGMVEERGVEQRYDQVFQLAAVAVDENFNQLSTIDLRARRKPNIVPSAGALVTTRIHPNTLDDAKMTEYDLARSFDEWTRQFPGGIDFYAWNMKFDRAMVRQMMWRTLGDIYLTTNINNHSGDLMRVAKAAYCFNPASEIVFPKRNGGQGRNGDKPSLKLGEMSLSNGISLEGAHDALNDVLATVKLAKRLKERDPLAWERLHELTTNGGVRNFLMRNPVFQWTKPDATSYYVSAFCSVTHKDEWRFREGAATNHKKSRPETLIFNLVHDPEPFLRMGDNKLLDALRITGSDKPFQIMKTNDHPVLWPYTEDPVTTPLAEPGADYTEREITVHKLRDARLGQLWYHRLERLAKMPAEKLSAQEAADLALAPAARLERLTAIPPEQLSPADKADLTLAQQGRVSTLDEQALIRRELEHRHELILNDRDFTLRASRLMEQIYDERDTGTPLMEDRLHNAMSLNIPQFEMGQLRTLVGFFHSHPWEEKDWAVDQIQALFKRPDAALKAANPEKYAEQMALFEHGLSMARLGRIVLYEREKVDGKEYIKNPRAREQLDEYVRQRLTVPATNSRGFPVPKYRTIDKAIADARADLRKYHDWPLDDSEQQRYRIEMTEACLAFYETLRPAPKPGPMPLFEQAAHPSATATAERMPPQAAPVAAPVIPASPTFNSKAQPAGKKPAQPKNKKKKAAASKQPKSPAQKPAAQEPPTQKDKSQKNKTQNPSQAFAKTAKTKPAIEQRQTPQPSAPSGGKASRAQRAASKRPAQWLLFPRLPIPPKLALNQLSPGRAKQQKRPKQTAAKSPPKKKRSP